MDNKLLEIPLFLGLSDKQLIELNEIANFNQYSAGEILFLEEDPADAFYAVLEGEVKIVKVTADGKEIILDTMVEGDFFGEMGILDERDRSATALISKKSRLMVLEKDNFIRFIKGNPEIALKIIIELSHRLRQANQGIEGLAFLDVESRLKRLLLRLAKKGKQGVSSLVLEKSITHQEMAKYIGSSRETVTRLINKLENQGFLKIEDSKIIMLNLERW